MYINEDMITDAMSELFRYMVPKRLAEYWNDQYTGSGSPSYVKNWADLGGILKSEYEAYAIGRKDSEEQHEIMCSQCIATNKYTRETGYKLELSPYKVCRDRHMG